jgi:hypothetical protein
VNIRLFCPLCDTPGRVALPDSSEWRCPTCDHLVQLHGGPSPALSACAVCGNHELYKKKDFPHGLGMAILVAACIASTVSYWLYDKVLTWAILLGSAAFDGLLYLWVKDVVVCYRCHAEHRGVSSAEHQPFELTVHERYRQERRRQEEVRGQKTEVRSQKPEVSQDVTEERTAAASKVSDL